MTDTKTNTKKAETSKVWAVKKYTLGEALLEFQKLQVGAKKSGTAQVTHGGKQRTYAKLEDVIAAVSQGNQFGLYFTQEIVYVYTSHADSSSDVVVRTTVRHIHDDATFVSELPIMLSDAQKANSQAVGSAITYAKRYTLQSLYGLPSEDDDGEKASKPIINTSKPKPRGEDDGLL